MMKSMWRFAVLVAVGVSICVGGAGGEEPHYLWEMGARDNNTAEFALGPNGYEHYSASGVFVAGASAPDRDWPYVHPGPEDTWAGAQQHTFVIAFGLASPVPEGAYRLHVDLVDSHYGSPPGLKIDVNGHEFGQYIPKGASDASVTGDPAAGKEFCFHVNIPTEALQAGGNQIAITTTSGSWMLYDWLGLEAPEGAKLEGYQGVTMLHSAEAPQLLIEKDGVLHQLVRIHVRHVGETAAGAVTAGPDVREPVTLKPGEQTLEIAVPAVEERQEVEIRLTGFEGAQPDRRTVTLEPVRHWEVYLLPHSHVDIGYTHVQTDVERIQCEFLDQCLELSEKTADYPEDARFKWNTEVLWAVDSFLRDASEEKREAFIDAVRAGDIGLDALYGNELTALCRPEELVELLGYGRRLAKEYGLTIDAAMISDVPGYTWGLVTAMAQSGIKYFSVGPNVGHRIGYTRSAWSDKPFYWVSPSGQEKVLFWMAGEGYSWFHRGPLRTGKRIIDYLDKLRGSGYPYAMTYGRYNIGGDNGPPDPNLPDFVKQWNERYAYPRLRIATTRETLRTFEERYGEMIPAVPGDFTPYWEDGAASSAEETVVNRDTAERLSQAEALYAMLRPGEYAPEAFSAAWRNVLLYDEHTWGAHNSISEPEGDFAKRQWAQKQAFALKAAEQADALLAGALGESADVSPAKAVHVFNTNSWPRTDLVVLGADTPVPGDRVVNAEGLPVASQRLSTGELVFLAENVPAFGAARFTVIEGEPHMAMSASASGCSLSNRYVSVMLDEATGAIADLRAGGIDANLVDTESGEGLNEYLYVAGRDPKEPQRNGKATITVKEPGPLVASLLVECDAPGCRGLSREVRLVSGLKRVDIIDVIDKENVYEKEAVHIAFPFNVPEGVMRINTPLAVMRPEADQIPGSCKNYFTVQRWVDVANQDYGVTWATPDAPLIEVGAIHCDPTVTGWMEHIEPSSKLYAYVMNNYWETNYKASQEGPTTFRFSLLPHGRYDGAAAERFGVERSQPLLAVPVHAEAPLPAPALSVAPSGIVVTALKPSDDGKDWVVRLYGASGKPEEAVLTSGEGKPVKAWFSDLGEGRGERVEGPVPVAPFGLVTLRVAMK